MSTNNADDAAAAVALTIARWAYGYYNGNSCGSTDALKYWDGVGKEMPGSKFTVQMVQDHLKPILTQLAALQRENAELKESCGTIGSCAKQYAADLQTVSHERDDLRAQLALREAEVTALSKTINEVEALARKSIAQYEFQSIARKEIDNDANYWRSEAVNLTSHLAASQEQLLQKTQLLAERERDSKRLDAFEDDAYTQDWSFTARNWNGSYVKGSWDSIRDVADRIIELNTHDAAMGQNSGGTT